nr:conjugal transfer nickase/helicase TraI [Raoultella sp. NCTC 9187]
MMSIGSVKSAGSASNYYTDKDNYYVIGSMDERWQGKGAEALGLDGKVDKQVFTDLLKGKLPDGSDLTRMQDGVNKHRPGYDLTFSAPKSVSVMAMIGGDKRLIDAHNQAVTEARKTGGNAGGDPGHDGRKKRNRADRAISLWRNLITTQTAIRSPSCTPMPWSSMRRRTAASGSLLAPIRWG